MAALRLDGVLNPPPDHLKVAILKDIGEDEGRLEHNLKLLETWVACQSHFPNNYEKQLLISFLRGSKHDMQRAKKRLERFFIIRSFDESLFRNRVMSMERDLMVPNNGFIIPLPELSVEGYRVILNTVASKDDFTLNVLKAVRYIYMIYDLRLFHDALSAGDVLVWDTRNISPSLAMKFLCTEFWKAIDFIQNTYPFRLKQIHMVTTSSLMIKAAGLVKQVLSNKLSKRFYIHPNLESVFKVVPQRLFPSDFGGEKKSILEIMEQWHKKFVELEWWFQKLEDVKVSGPIPKEFEQILSDVYGPEGSFRQISID